MDWFVLQPDVIYLARITKIVPEHGHSSDAALQRITVSLIAKDTAGVRGGGNSPIDLTLLGFAEFNQTNGRWGAKGKVNDYQLREEQEYVLFLRRRSDVLYRIVAAYSVDDYGVACGQGVYVHGFGAYGPICLRNSVSGGLPPKPAEVIRGLRTLRTRAQSRFPDWNEELHRSESTAKAGVR